MEEPRHSQARNPCSKALPKDITFSYTTWRYYILKPFSLKQHYQGYLGAVLRLYSHPIHVGPPMVQHFASAFKLAARFFQLPSGEVFSEVLRPAVKHESSKTWLSSWLTTGGFRRGCSPQPHRVYCISVIAGVYLSQLCKRALRAALRSTTAAFGQVLAGFETVQLPLQHRTRLVTLPIHVTSTAVASTRSCCSPGCNGVFKFCT